MAIFGSLVALLKTDNTAWNKGFDEAVVTSYKATEKTKSQLQQLNDAFGKRSALGQSLKLLSGGGALAGFSKAGNELAEFTQKMVDLKKAADGSRGSFGAIAQTVAESLPVFGGFYKAGENIREMFTGEKAAIDQVNESLARSTSLYDKMMEAVAKSKKTTLAALEGFGKDQQQASRKMLLSGITNDLAKDSQSALFDFQDKTTELRKKAAEAIDQKSIDANRAALEAEKATQVSGTIHAGWGGRTTVDDTAVREHEDRLRTLQQQTIEDNKRKVAIEAGLATTLEAERVAYYGTLDELQRKQFEKQEQDANAQAEKEFSAFQAGLKKQEEARREALEKRKDELEKIISDAEKIPDRAGTQTTANVRGGLTVQLAPQFDNPMKAIAEQSKKLLETVVKQLGEITKNTGAGDTTLNVAF